MSWAHYPSLALLRRPPLGPTEPWWSQRKLLTRAQLVLRKPPTAQGWHQLTVPIAEQDGPTMQLSLQVLEADRRIFQFWLSPEESPESPWWGYVSAGPRFRGRISALHPAPAGPEGLRPPLYLRLEAEGYAAYQTPLLLQPEKATALGELQLALTNFCVDTHLRVLGGDFPLVGYQEPELPFQAPTADPLRWLRFSPSSLAH